MSEEQVAKTPLHLWIVGIVALLWNLIGAFDYVMTETKNDAYMSKFTPEQLDYFYGLPAWFVAFWALAVWGGVLGAVLLLLRKKLAMPVLVLSFLCMVISTIYSYLIAGGADIMGATGVVFSVVIFFVALALVIYSRSMVKRGVLV